MSSFTVSNIIGVIETMTWKSKANTNVQLNYVVTVQPGGTVKPDLEEHSDYQWAKQGDIEALYMTSEMKIVVQDTFKFTIASI